MKLCTNHLDLYRFSRSYLQNYQEPAIQGLKKEGHLAHSTGNINLLYFMRTVAIKTKEKWKHGGPYLCEDMTLTLYETIPKLILDFQWRIWSHALTYMSQWYRLPRLLESCQSEWGKRSHLKNAGIKTHCLYFCLWWIFIIFSVLDFFLWLGNLLLPALDKWLLPFQNAWSEMVHWSVYSCGHYSWYRCGYIS